MKVRNLLIASLVALGLVAFSAGQAAAVNVGINIEVFKNGVSQGTAFGGASTSTNTPLIVTASTGDTLRFVVYLNQDPATNTGSYGSNITGDLNNASGGSAELRFVAAGAVDLSGLGFVNIGANPNTQLNDATPGNGNANTPAGSVNSVNLYRVDYVVQTVVTDGLRDFNVVLTGYTSSPAADLLDPALDSASVRVDSGGAPPIPEPATLLLLGSGLAGLAGFGRRSLRK